MLIDYFSSNLKIVNSLKSLANLDIFNKVVSLSEFLKYCQNKVQKIKL